MFPLLTGLISGGASLLGSIFSSNTSAQNTQAQIAAQAANQKEAEEFNAQQAQINRDYQTQMSNTAFQRSRADAEAAGINPMALAGMGGASTPGGSSTSISPAPAINPNRASPLAGIGSAVERGLSAAISAKTMDKMTDEIANLQTSRKLYEAETELTQQRRSTETEETRRRMNEATISALSVPTARRAADRVIAIEKLPQWARDAADIAPYLSNSVSSVTDAAGGLLSSASGARRLLQFPDSPTRKFGPSDRQYMKDTFDELWDRRAH